MCDDSDKYHNEFKKNEDQIKGAIIDTMASDVLPDDTRERLGRVINQLSLSVFSNENRERDEFRWREYYASKVTESFVNNKKIKEGFKEGNANRIPTINFIQDAINSRHSTFKDIVDFNEQCETNANISSKDVINTERNDINKLVNYAISGLKSYKTLHEYQISLSALINTKLNELNKSSNKIDTYQQNLYIDGRKDSYENSNYDFYKSINFYILIGYYGLLICYFIFSSFFTEKKYNDYLILSIILFYTFLPIILPYLLSLIYNIYEYIIESNNLREDIISYPYIIEDKKKYK
tara:strand:+ start:2718 stop:3599 length:882 start_codon:yes stop_codon:yes gene_type:complete